MDAPAIRTRGLGKRYGSRTVVEALDLEVPPGSVSGWPAHRGTRHRHDLNEHIANTNA